MYITVKTIKRDLGFKGIEIADILIGFPIATIFILLFSLSDFKLLALIFLMIGIFLLLPIRVSMKNRMYKVLIMIFMYYVRVRNYVYSNENIEKRRVILIDEIRRKVKY